MRASILLPVLSLLLAACGGGSGGGGDDGETAAATGSPPTISVADPDDPNTNSLSLLPVSSDPDGDDLSYSWAVDPGSVSQAVLIVVDDPVTGEATFTFPMNGPYTLVVTADDGNGNQRSASVAVVVADPDPFSIDGEVSDDGSAASGLACELYFNPVGEGTVAATASTDATAGAFSFDQLIGDKDQFTVLVPGS